MAAGRIVKAINKAGAKKIAKDNIKRDAVGYGRASKKMTPGVASEGNAKASAAAGSLAKTQQAGAKAGLKAKTVTKATKKGVKLGASSSPRAAKKAEKASKGSKFDFSTPKTRLASNMDKLNNLGK